MTEPEHDLTSARRYPGDTHPNHYSFCMCKNVMRTVTGEAPDGYVIPKRIPVTTGYYRWLKDTTIVSSDPAAVAQAEAELDWMHVQLDAGYRLTECDRLEL